ncbi:MAG: hypothetical protein AAFX94_02805 [Myxococcota bacterium]
MAQMVSFDNGPIRVNARGEWLQGGEPLHPRVVELFSRHLVPSMDGRVFIQLGFQRYELEIEDTAYFVTAMDIEKDGPRLTQVRLTVSDGREELLRPDSLMQSAENVLYCRVLRRELGVACRFSPSLYHTLALEMDEDDAGFYLELNRVRHRVAVYDRTPLPMT